MEPTGKTIIEKHGFYDIDRKKTSHDEIQLWVYKNFRTIIKEVFPHLAAESIALDLKLEYAVTNRGFIVGFIDVYCNKLGVAIEVKTEIPTIGDLIRQIHFYSKYMNVPKWIVVSPDEKPAAILKEQGIHFFKYSTSQLRLF